MKHIILALMLVSTFTVGCASARQQQHLNIPSASSAQQDTYASLEEVCNEHPAHASLRAHGTVVDGVTYFCF